MLRAVSLYDLTKLAITVKRMIMRLGFRADSPLNYPFSLLSCKMKVINKTRLQQITSKTCLES